MLGRTALATACRFNLRSDRHDSSLPRAANQITPTDNRRKSIYWLRLRFASALGVGVAVLLFVVSQATATSYYWTGNSAGGATWNSIIGGTNWSIDPNSLQDPGTFPGSTDDVFFVFNPETNPTTTLGQDFSIKGLTFNSGVTSTVTIGGANLLTIGVDGLTVNSSASDIINANVAIGAVEIWANNSPSATTLTIGGQISGSSALTLEGTGSTSIPSGAFIFNNSNTFSGALTLLNANTALTLSGGGTLAAASSITLGGGTSLTLDNGSSVATRLAGTVPVTSTGGTLRMLGNSLSVASDSIGTLTVGSGHTSVNVTPAGQTTTLTLNGLTRNTGGTINFAPTSATAVVATPSLSAGLIGRWASVGLEDGTGSLDFANVASGQVTAYSGYNTGLVGTWAGTDVKNSTSQTLTGALAINSLYSTTGGITNVNSRALTITSGGVIANGGTGTYVVNGNQTMLNASVLGGTGFSAGASAFATGSIQAGPGISDLVFNVAGDSTIIHPAAVNTSTGVLQVNVKIVDPLVASLSTTTANNSTTVTTSSTAGLAVGQSVEGLVGYPAGTYQKIVSVVDGTHFTIGNTITTGAGTGTATISTPVGLTKTGGGLLDLANGNNTGDGNTFTGPMTINAGTVLVRADVDFGFAPPSAVANAITLNGGEIRSTAGFTIAANRGIAVGPQGGTISYDGGGTFVASSKIAGTGGMTFRSISNSGNTTFNMSIAAGGTTYQGPTTLVSKTGSNITFTVSNELPTGTPVTILAYQPATAAPGYGTVVLVATNQTWGSLSSTGTVGTITGTTGGLTLGGTVANPVNQSASYGGTISGTNLTKNGGGTQTFTNANTYSGTTNINGGKLVVTNTSGSGTGTSVVNVNNGGALGGSGIISGAVTVNSGGILAPAVVSSGASTLQLGSTLALNGGSILNFNLGAVNTGTNPIASPTSDNVFMSGALPVGAGTDTINLSSIGTGIVPGTYSLITATGGVPGSFTGTTFNVHGPLQFLYTVVDNTGNNSLDLQVINNPTLFLTWVGAPGNGTWDLTSTNKPWTFTGGAGAFAYQDGSVLTFDNTPGANSAINVGTNVAPGSMTFNNNVLVSYSFNGTGQITGSTGFVKKNTGTVTFNNTNTFTGLADIQNGGIVVGAGGSLADASYNIAAIASLTVNGSLGDPAITNAGTFSVGSTGSIAADSTLSNSGSASFSNAAQTLATITGAGSLTLNGTALTITGTSTYAGAIGGTGSMNTSGTTALTLSAANSYGGGTNIGAGSTLIVTNTTGSGTGTGTVTVDGTLRGTGAVGGPIDVNAGGTLQPSGTGTWGSSVAVNGAYSPAGAGAVGTINLGATTINNGATLNYDFGRPAASDATNVPSLTTSGTVTLNVNPLGGFNQGQYTLFTSAGSLSDAATYSIVPGGPIAGFPTSNFSVTNDGTHLFLNVNFTGNPSLVWTGANGIAWDLATANWTSPGVFTNGASVRFDDTNVSGNNVIAVDAGGVNPSQITFANSAQDYTINGPGAIGGIGISKGGSGTVTLNGAANTMVGPTSISSGTLAIAADGSLGTAPLSAVVDQLTINGGQLTVLGTTTLATTRGIQIGNAVGTIGANATTGATVNVAAGITTYNGIIANVTGQAGILNKAGPGELDLGGANTFTGGMNINNGPVKLTATAAGGTGRVTVNVGGALAVGANLLATTPITIADGTIGPSVANATPAGDVTIATGTTATVDIFDPTVPANRFDLILAGTLHGSGNINVQQAANVNNPDNQGFRLRGPSSPDYTGTITVGQDGKFEVQNAGASGSPAGTGLIVLTGGTLNGNNTGTFSLFNVRNNNGTALANTTFGNNVSLAGTGVAAMNLVGTVATGSTTNFGHLTIGDQQDLAAVSTGTAGWILAFSGATLTGGNATFTPHPVGNTSYTSDENIQLGAISESAAGSGFTMNGNAALILAAANGYTGTATVQSGTMRLGAAGALPALSSLVVNGGTVDFNNAGTSNNQTVASLSGGGGVITNSDPVLTNIRTFTVNQASNTDYFGAINATLKLVKSGSGTLSLQGTSSYSGGTTITGGILSISSDSAAAGSSANLGIVPAAATPGSITLNGGTLGITSTLALNPNRGIALGTSGGSIDAALGTTLTYNGIIADAPTQIGALSLVDTGEVDLGAANTYSGGTSVNAGTLGVVNTTGSATGSGTVTVAGSATLAGTGRITGPSIVNGHVSPGLGFSNIGTLHLGATTLSTGSILDYDLLTPTNSDTSATGMLDLGSAMTVNINAESGFALGTYKLVTSTGLSGSPTYTVNHSGSGDNPNLIYNVATVGNNIVLTVDAIAQKWTGAHSNVWDTTTANWDPAVNLGIYADNQFKQVFDDTGTNTNITIPNSVSPLALVFTNNTVPYTLSGQAISGNGSVLIQGPGTVTLGSPNSYAGGTTLMGGRLNIGDSQAISSGRFTIAGGTIDNSAGILLTLGFNNPQTLAGSFTFVGTNDLNLGSGPATLTTTPTITVSASTLTVGGVIDDAGSGFGLTKDGPGTLALSGANTYTGPTTILAGNLNVTIGGTLGGGTAPLTVSTSGTVDLGGNSLNVGAVVVTAGTITNGTLTAPSFASNNIGAVSISANLAGPGALTKTLAGTTTLSGTNAYTGGTTISGGTLRVSADNNLGAAPAVATPGSLTINGATLSATGSFVLSSTRGVAIGSGGATIDVASGAVVSYGGIMADVPSQSGALVKTNTGELDLGGANTYSGGTTVSAGALGVTNLTGSGTGSGTVVVNSSGALAGTGRIAGSVNLSGHLAPGLGTGGIGTLHLASTSLNTGAILDYDLAGLAAFDSTAASTLNLGTSLTVNVNALSGFSLGTYNLVTGTSHTGSPTYTLNHSGPGDNPNFIYNIATVGNNIVLTVDATTQKWTGAAGSGGNGTWDTTSVNWTPSVHGGVYGDNLFKQVFDDTGTNTNITINSVNGSVSPLGVLFSNNTVPYTISGQPIAGSTAIVIQGPGTVSLNSQNTYTNGTTLLGGTLNIGDSGALGSGTFAISGGVFDNTTGTANTLGSNINEIWAGSFTFLGSNVDNTHDLNLGTGAVTLTATPTVTVAGSASTLTVGGSIGDAGAGFGFTKAGAGTLVLTAANTYSGTTTLAAGNLNVIGNGTLGGGTAPLIVSGVTLDLGGTIQNVGPVTITAGTTQNGTLTAPSFVINDPLDVSIPAILAGPGGLAKSGAGTAVLGGVNTFAGNTSITGGTLSISVGTNLGTAPATVVPNSITLDGGTLLVTAGMAANVAATLNANRGMTLGANGGTLSIGFTNPTLTLGQETAFIYNGVITGPGGLTIVGQAGIDQANQSILDISTVATYQGNTTISSAVAQVNSGTTGANTGAAAVVNILPTGTTLNLINNGAWNMDANASSLTVAGLTGDATGRIGTTNQTNPVPITLGGAGSYDFPGIIGAFTVAGKLGNDVRVSLVKTGSGTQTLDGANTYTGGTTVNNGVLTTTGPSGSIGNGPLAVNAADTVTSVVNLGTVQPVTSLSGTVAGTGTARVNVAAGAALNDSQTTSTVFPGAVNLAASASPNGGGTLGMSGTNGVLEVQRAGSLGNNSNINVSNGTLRYNVTTGGPAVVGSGVLATVTNAGVLELAGSVAALSDGTGPHSVNVLNNSIVSDGLHVTGMNQQVGGVDGNGSTQVVASASLTANHIVQNALIIGGTDATHTGLVTIDASDANGNSLASSGGGLSLAGSLAPSDSFGSGAATGSSLTGIGDSSSSAGLSVGGAALGGGSASAVPEPSTFVLVALGLAALGYRATRKKST